VIIYISTLSDFSLQYRNDSLLAPSSANYAYQWYLDSIPLADSMGGRQQGINLADTGTYKVVITDNMRCSKEASYYYSVQPPIIDKIFIVCSGNSLPVLSAVGNNINWYKDSLLGNLIVSGNSYRPNIIETDTFYVTQTVNNIQSWPKQVIVSISTLSDFSLQFTSDSLLAPKSSNYTYQWYLNNIPIMDSMGGTQQAFKPANTGTYKVVITDNMSCTEYKSPLTLLETI
jgi:membrane carboxypeptidase/penicillin-binding protein PbpC